MKPVAIIINGEDTVGFRCAEQAIGEELTEKVLDGQATNEEPWPVYDSDLSEIGDSCEYCGLPLYFCNHS